MTHSETPGKPIITGKPIGIVGCGAMGLPMAQQLRAKDVPVLGLDLPPVSRYGLFEPHMTESPRVIAESCDIVFSVVRDSEQTDMVCFGPRGLFSQIPYPLILVICSTVPPGYVDALRRRLPDEVHLVDAAISGAPIAAREARLTFMVGGDLAVMEHLNPLFHCMGHHIHHLGPLGSGMTVKVLNNFVAASSVVAVRRVCALAEPLGVAPGKLRAVMAQSSGGTWFGDNFDRIDWAREGYGPDTTIGILEKDVCAYQDGIAEVCESDAALAADNVYDTAVLAALRRLQSIE